SATVASPGALFGSVSTVTGPASISSGTSDEAPWSLWNRSHATPGGASLATVTVRLPDFSSAWHSMSSRSHHTSTGQAGNFPSALSSVCSPTLTAGGNSRSALGGSADKC